ncbi:glutaredoxin family protein [Roseivivax sp. CAU 1761]
MRQALAVAALVAATPAAAGPFDTLEARAALGEELRELFRDEPELVRPALGLTAPQLTAIAQDLYADEIAADLGRIEAEAARLFAPDRPGPGPEGALPAIALLVGPDCPDCAAAQAELDALARRLGLRAAVIDVAADPADRAMMERLTLDMVPSYVMPDRMIRGHMPQVVLERYLTE